MTRKTKIDQGLDAALAAKKPGKKMTYEEIASYCGVSRMTIARLEASALKKLYHAFSFEEREMARELLRITA